MSTQEREGRLELLQRDPGPAELRLAMPGAAVGLVCALIVSHLMAGLLYAVRPTDPLTFAGVAVLLLFVALLASYLPARRAVRVEPPLALRHE